ncbi:hypothetical protein OH76DRAFT_978624 [Lentinus brumalis]|uniref:Uncharacterized protein n=1 Tax=Lentinus brumalis TaxID=2498619 RepID=A0A371DPV6_9APHY|nr:hypothetical protein OH76DRAFT_978624 [Polyporus brumalis]
MVIFEAAERLYTRSCSFPTTSILHHHRAHGTLNAPLKARKLQRLSMFQYAVSGDNSREQLHASFLLRKRSPSGKPRVNGRSQFIVSQLCCDDRPSHDTQRHIRQVILCILGRHMRSRLLCAQATCMASRRRIYGSFVLRCFATVCAPSSICMGHLHQELPPLAARRSTLTSARP